MFRVDDSSSSGSLLTIVLCTVTVTPSSRCSDHHRSGGQGIAVRIYSRASTKRMSLSDGTASRHFRTHHNAASMRPASRGGTTPQHDGVAKQQIDIASTSTVSTTPPACRSSRRSAGVRLRADICRAHRSAAASRWSSARDGRAALILTGLTGHETRPHHRGRAQADFPAHQGRTGGQESARRLRSDGWTGDARRDQCAMTPPCGLSPSRSSGIRTHARAVNAADTRMSGVSRLPNAC